MKDPYKYFRVEARELVGQLSAGVLALEKGEGREAVQRLLRVAHTLKGAARVVKQIDIAELAHQLETLLAPHRDSGEAAGEADRLLALVDAISAKVAALPDGASEQPKAAPLVATKPIEIAELDALLEAVSEASVRLSSLEQKLGGIQKARELCDVLRAQLAPRPSSEAVASLINARSIADQLGLLFTRSEREVAAESGQLGTELSLLYDAANHLRLLPASILFGPLERAARDAAHALGKSIAFVTSGGEERLDAHVVAAVADALAHATRNAVAHGIENENQRRAAGKPGIGKIEIAVEKHGNTVAFLCRDDGGGIDVAAVERAAGRGGRGLDRPLDAQSAGQLLLQGGLTTSAVVNQVAGRGIGLDVVRETAARLKGEVSLQSRAGEGTVLCLSVPIALSSERVLVVEAGERQLAVPIVAVEETLRIARDALSRSADKESLLHRGEALPFLRLRDAIGAATTTTTTAEPRIALIVRHQKARAAIAVDRLLGTQNVILRPLPKLVFGLPIVAGAALDSEGHPRLVLDAASLVLAASQNVTAPLAAPAKATPILIIDDSLTTRMLEQSILETAGYEVDLATSAEDGLEQAKRKTYGLFLVDVEMPKMNGFQFIAETQADPLLRAVPSILVTSRNAVEDRRRGEEVGARAYVVKGEFDQNRLLQTIRQLVR